eukprot:TRINITY_DN1038_c6_g1_i1.p1 TRINITY_DN1038_c6_g1~~TRINITY_DN1038_c6_g1_i1.p1  ORF type:complete len:131 (-),score=22.46 TRINITY_DN1038_c6_g1_i1:129-521(-)
MNKLLQHSIKKNEFFTKNINSISTFKVFQNKFTTFENFNFNLNNNSFNNLYIKTYHSNQQNKNLINNNTFLNFENLNNSFTQFNEFNKQIEKKNKIEADSTLRKRKRKMNKHKHRKRLKRDRILNRKLGK